MDRLSTLRLGAFVSLEVPMSAFLTPLIVYIPAFYAGEKGLGLATVGIVFGLTKLWDIISDPIAGSITDRFGPATGRWRFWLLISLPIMLLGVYKVFLPPAEVGWEYFAFWMVLLYVGWTLLTISHISWGVDLSMDYHERSRIAAYRQFAALIGSLVIVFIPVLSDQFSGADQSVRIRNMGLFVMLALPVLSAAVVWSAPAGSSRERRGHTYRLRDSVTILVHNKSLRALLIGNMGILLGLGATSSVLLFYVESVLRLREWATLAIVPLLFSGMLFLPVMKRLAVARGKHQTFRMVLLFQIVVQPLFLIIPAENLLVTALVFVLLGAVYGAVIFLPQAMIADLKDFRTEGVVGRTGIYVALLQSTSKVSGALAVALMFILLPLTGFDPEPSAVNDSQSLRALRYLMVILPAACYGIGWFAMRYYERSGPDQAVDHSQANVV